MNGKDLLIIVGLPVAAILLGLLFGVLLPRVRRKRTRSIPLVIGPFEATVDAVPRPSRPTKETGAVPSAPWTAAESVEARAAQRSAPAASPPPATSPDARPSRVPAGGHRGNLAVVSSSVPDLPAESSPVAPQVPAASAQTRPRLEVVTAESPAAEPPRPAAVRPLVAVDGTLQFLPGRLEIIQGREIGQELRFVRQPGASVTEVTLGRAEGEPYRHLQLHEPTVSRMHAKMIYEGKQWRLANLSVTNPVVVNGSPLEGDGASAVLSEGDRIEMGEVVLLYRAK